MVTSATSAAAQQSYLTQVQTPRNENQLRNPEQRPEDGSNAPLQDTSRSSVERTEAGAKNENEQQRASALPDTNQLTGTVQSETQQRGSLVDVSA